MHDHLTYIPPYTVPIHSSATPPSTAPSVSVPQLVIFLQRTASIHSISRAGYPAHSQSCLYTESFPISHFINYLLMSSLSSQPSSPLRYVLVMGLSAQGKSTVCNVLTSSAEFMEGSLSSGTTQHSQSKQVVINGQNYVIMDTIGIDDPDTNAREVLTQLSQVLPNSLYRILFVFGSRFNSQEIKVWNLLTTILFQPSICPYITVVRTHFPQFRKVEMCLFDRHLLLQNPATTGIINSCHSLCHVDNVSAWQEPTLQSRIDSRAILLQSLTSPVYNRDDLTFITQRIAGYRSPAELLAEQRLANTGLAMHVDDTHPIRPPLTSSIT